jgi:hypothetical protein
MCKNCKGEEIDENRFITTGYVCEYCDSDFGINEFGMNTPDGIYSVCCPVCKSPVLRVYHWVSRSDEGFPSPTMSKEVLDLIHKEQEAKIWKDWRVPSDGSHGIDESLFEMNTCCCGDADLCDGKESCCTECDTHARFPTDFAAVMDKIRGRQPYSDLDAQVEEERKERRAAFDRFVYDRYNTEKIKKALKELLDTPSMEE